jgi:ankyrin repeat protein
MKCSNTELNELRCITAKPYGDRDWVAEQQFPDIHQIIFGESSKLLIVELNENPGAVHVKDAMGRTALDWATARGQLCDMRLLIQYGSRLDTMDISGRTTVLHAVDSHNDNALRILLDAGANPNPIVPERHRRSSPLIAASFGGRKGMMKQLIYRQAKIDACNPEGRTALQAVASIDNVACADILLGAGANPVDISSNGYSAITTAIAFNSHAVLQFFLKRCGNHLKELRIDQIILVFADTSTTGILRSAGLLHQTTRMKIAPGPTYDEKLGNILGHLGRQGRQ